MKEGEEIEIILYYGLRYFRILIEDGQETVTELKNNPYRQRLIKHDEVGMKHGHKKKFHKKKRKYQNKCYLKSGKNNNFSKGR